MVLIRGKRAGLAAALDGLQGGLQAGFGMGQQMRRTQLAEREQQAQEERYKQSVALASQAAALDAQREKRYADEAARNNQLQDEQRAGARALIDSRIEGITPEQTKPGYIANGGMLQSDFDAGLSAHHARVLDHAKAASRNISPEFLDRFWGDVSSGLQNDQQKAQIAKFQSDLEGFGNDANTELGGGPIRDLMGEAGDGQAKKGSGALGRFGELKGILDSIAGQDPMLAATPEERQKMLAERQKALQVVAQGIGQTHDLLNREELRREEVASTVAQYQQAFAAEEQGLAALGKSPEAMVLRERLKAKKLALIQYKRDRDFDLQGALEAADKITLPTARGGAGAQGGGSDGPKPLTPSDQLSLRKQAIEELPDKQKKDEAAIRAKMSQMQGTDGFSEEAISGALSKAFGSKKPPEDVEAAATSLYEQLSRSGLDPAKVDEQVSEFLRHNGRDPGEREKGGKREEFDPKMGDSVLNKKKPMPKSKPTLGGGAPVPGRFR